ncbi:MAG: hypothetical protein ACQEQV_08255 [Fibrobacterota bacterium]
MNTDKTKKILLITLFSALALLALLLSLRSTAESTASLPKNKRLLRGNLNPLENNIIEKLTGQGVRDSSITISTDLETGLKEVICRVPRGIPMEEFIQDVQRAVENTSYTLKDCYMNDRNLRATLLFTSSKKDREDIQVRLRPGGYFAEHTADIYFIVEDLEKLPAGERVKFLTYDGGKMTYTVDLWNKRDRSFLTVLQQYNMPLCVSIPLETRIKKQTVRSRFTIMLDDNREEVAMKLDDLMRPVQTPAAAATRGGTLALSNSTLRTHLFTALSKKEIPLYDRRPAAVLTSPTAEPARKDAAETGLILRRKNTVFTIDSSASAADQMRTLARQALRKRELTVWTQADPAFISALEEITPYLQERGIHVKAIERSNAKGE